MPEWLLWAVAVLTAVAAGWTWSSWRHRASTRSNRPTRRSEHPPRRSDRPTRPADRQRPRPSDRARPTRRRDRTATVPRPRTTTGTPRPGEIWWADVPYADGSGSKIRPCLVLRADDRGADVLKITSQDKSNRDEHVRIPTRSWDPDAEHDSFLNLDEPIRVDADAFSNRAGTCDPALWRYIRTLPHLPSR